MKKIAIVLFEVVNEFGGILNHTVNLAHGLRENGCRVDIFYPLWRERVTVRKTSGKLIDAGLGLQVRISEKGDRGVLTADEDTAIAYKGWEQAEALREQLSEYDGVIVEMVPSFGDQKRRKDSDWLRVLSHGRPMVNLVHDSHWIRFYPWILKLQDRITALSAVHPAAFHSATNWPGRVACVVNPFDISQRKVSVEKNWDWLCVTSFFKRWKHVDDGVRAVPYLKPLHLWCMGGGIEYYNMKAEMQTSRNYRGTYYESYKNKLLRYIWKENDPSFKEKWFGKKIWDVALDSGHFHYMGMRVGKTVDSLQEHCGGLIDFSYQKKWGEHFNRVIVEAMLHRCIPFARPYGISDNAEGKGVVFGPDNVVLIPEEASPKRTAEIIKSAMRDETLREELIARNLKDIRLFDRRVVALQFLQLLQGNLNVGLFGVVQGQPDKEVFKAMKATKAIVRFPRSKRFPRLRIRFPRLKKSA